MREKKTRRIAVEQWTCPNHPDGPPTLPAEGWEREELTLEQAYSADEVIALLHVMAVARPRAKRATGVVGEMLGICCLGHRWKTVGYEDVEVGPFEEFMREMRGPMQDIFRQGIDGSILLREWSKRDGDQLQVRIPIIVSPEAV